MKASFATATFLFTDIEGSTRLWERQASAMSTALAHHDRIVRTAIERHGGRVFKTVGDAFCAVFRNAVDGVAGASEVQQRISDEAWGDAPIVVRCALHAGTAEERDDDYFGPTLNRVARLLSAAHGGQVLLSQAAAELAREALPEGVSLLNLGTHRLRDLEREETIYQLALPGARNEFPPIRTLRARHDNLPSQAASFIGRERECAELSALLVDADTRLITLTGPGGCGKTRLALQVCGNCIEEFADGACFVPLASIRDPDLVASAIAHSLNLREGGDLPVRQTLLDYLQDKSLLLLLDNFEQVMNAAPLVAELMALPKSRVIVTSREPLHLYGERDYPVPPLDTPSSPDAANVSSSAAARLFVDRARAADPRFELTVDNARSIAEICERLDGLPLAIELAAARIRLFSPRAMLERLDSRLDILAGGARDLPERQRTMRGAIEWSHMLLDEHERSLFRRLGVFSGGFTLNAAEEVCTLDASADVLTGVASLMSKSLLSPDAAPATDDRFRMLETVREYALERAEAAGELPAMRERHAAWALRLAEVVRDEVHGSRQLAALARCEDEHDNSRAALAWLAERDGVEGLRLAVALAPFWRLHSHLTEGQQWLAHGLAATASTADDRLKGEALLWSGLLATHAGDHTGAQELSEQAVDVATALNDSRLRGRACTTLGWLALVRGSIADAVSSCREAVDLLRSTSDEWGLADALHFLGHAQADDGGLESARPAWEESLRLFRAVGDGWSQALPLKDLGWIEARSGNHSVAAGLYEQSLAVHKEIGDKWHVADTLMRLGELALFAGDRLAAADRFGEALSIARDLGNKTVIVEGLMRCAELSETQGDYQGAALLLEEALEMARGISHERLIAAALHNLANVALYNGDVDRTQRMLSECTAIHRALGRDLEVALDLSAFAALAFARGQYSEAARLFGAADAACGGIDVMRHRADRLEFSVGRDEEIGSLRAALGSEIFERARAEGSSLSCEEALALADGLAMPADHRSVHGST